jgi:hypothetical protein
MGVATKLETAAKEGKYTMTKMLIDGVKSITLHGNVVRIHCVAVGADGKEETAGTLLIPGNEVGPIVQSLVNGLQEMQKQMRERAAAEASSKSN